MSEEKIVNKTKVRLEKTDNTELSIDAFVYYARENLELGSGFGTAIAVRGGPSIQEELKKIGSANLTEAVVTSAGEMKAKYIVHAVGPKFQEENMETKLSATIRNALNEAEKKGITSIALPAMGAGFFGVPLDISAKVTVSCVKEFLKNKTNLREVVLCMLDSKQFKAFQEQLAKLS